jgi:hypothetical protein
MKYEKSRLHYQGVTTSETQWKSTLHCLALFSDKINGVDQICSYGLNWEVLQIINLYCIQLNVFHNMVNILNVFL